MTPHTEKCLRTILEKILNVRFLLDVKFVQGMPCGEKYRIIADSRSVGATFSDCSSDFKSRCSCNCETDSADNCHIDAIADRYTKGIF